MPLVLLAKARRASAAARERAAEVYGPAMRNLRPFAVAWATAATKAVPDPVFDEVLRRAAARAPRRTPEEILAAVPWLDTEVTDNPLLASAWDYAPLTNAYLRVLADVGEVEKRRRRVPTVRVNPRSIEWARERGSRLIRNVSASTKETVRNIVARHIERGERAESMVSAIRRAVGLLPREEQAVDTRRELLIDQGVSASRADELSDRYASDLREARAWRIARTETIAAQNRGLLDTWQEAADSGALPAGVVRVWSSAPESENPNRPCQICLDLDGTQAKLGEPFESELLESSVMTPPAHPNCRCTMTLQREGG